MPEHIHLTLARTISTGSYESARVEVGLDVDADPKERDIAYRKAREWVAARLAEEVAAVRAASGKRL